MSDYANTCVCTHTHTHTHTSSKNYLLNSQVCILDLKNNCFYSVLQNRGSNRKKEVPGGLVVRILGFYCCGLDSVPGQGTEILQATWCAKNKERKGMLGNSLPKGMDGQRAVEQ